MSTAFPACRLMGQEAAPVETEAAAAPAEAAPTGEAVATETISDITELEVFIRRVDEKADELRTLEAEVTYTKAEGFSGRESVYSGKVYVRKPHGMFVDFRKPYPRKVWFSENEILDYKEDLNTAEKVTLAEDGETPEIIGLTARFGEMRDRFAMSLEKKSRDGREFDVLTLVPLPDVEADFTSAEVEIDAVTLLPVKVEMKDDELDQTKTLEFSAIKENPRLRASVFEPKLRRDTDVEEFHLGDWKGL
jgi:outer membrane lipoprotein-sorting protein